MRILYQLSQRDEVASNLYMNSMNLLIKKVSLGPRYYLKSSSYYKPLPEKASTGGEDACFVGDQILVVADGVGGWRKRGIDSGKYAREFCELSNRVFKTNPNYYLKNPKKVLVKAAQSNNLAGSATCCILIMDESKPVLRTAYIGDCGYLILRKEFLVESPLLLKSSAGLPEEKGKQVCLKPIFFSEEQTKEFNYPYQVGAEGDDPEISKTYEHELKENDVIIAGSDGLFDNLGHKEIIDIIKPFLISSDKIYSLEAASEFLAQKAFEVSNDKNYQSPYAKRANSNGKLHSGGKKDDITVVVAQVEFSSK